jgi:hypothetical protein
MDNLSRLNDMLDPSKDQTNRRAVMKKIQYYKNKVKMYENKLKRQFDGSQEDQLSVSALSSNEPATASKPPSSPLFARISNLKSNATKPENKDEKTEKTVNFLQ